MTLLQVLLLLAGLLLAIAMIMVNQLKPELSANHYNQLLSMTFMLCVACLLLASWLKKYTGGTE